MWKVQTISYILVVLIIVIILSAVPVSLLPELHGRLFSQRPEALAFWGCPSEGKTRLHEFLFQRIVLNVLCSESNLLKWGSWLLGLGCRHLWFD